MNDIFNISRFGRLFKKHTAEYYKSYFMSLTVLIGVLVLGGAFLTFIIPDGHIDVQFQSVIYVIIMPLAGTMFTSTIFGAYGNKNKAIASLTLPASHFEKYMVAWLYSSVIFVAVFTVTFYLILLFLFSLKHLPGQTLAVFNIFHTPVGYQVFLLFALLHSIAFYGAILFEKLHFIKTAFAFFIAMAAMVIFNKILLSVLFGRDVVASPPFTNARFNEKSEGISISVISTQESQMLIVIAVLTIIFWTAAYYRLKEKQV